MIVTRVASCWRLAAVVAALVLGALVTASPAAAQTVIASEDFESGDFLGGSGWLTDWTSAQDEGSTAVLTTGEPHTGAWHMRLRGEEVSAWRSADVTAYPGIRIKFWAKLTGWDSGDRGRAQVSADGSAWTTLKTWANGDDTGQWASYDFDFAQTGVSFASGEAFVRFFVDAEDGSLYVDDVAIEDAPTQESPPAAAPGAIVLDSNFADWTGHALLSDPSGDSSGGARHDLHEFYWANNLDQEINYYMVRRYTSDGQPFNGENGQSRPVTYVLHLDTNNNGNYAETSDRIVQVSYEPKANHGRVRVRVRRAGNFHLIRDSGWQDFGETRGEGGLRAEFAVSWQDLGISLGAVIRMYVTSQTGSMPSPTVRDRLPDGNADVQWSPASILGPWLLAAAFALGALAIWYLKGRHIWRRG